jgi:uncharacterized protein (DUF305 family)
MRRRLLLHTTALIVCAPFFYAGASLLAQQSGAVSVVQPGAPGHANRQLTPETTGLHLMPPTVADTQFMQGMIMHHGQAVEMTELVKTHSHDPKVLEIGRRIGVSQTSEMTFMKLWLTDRGLPIEDPNAMGGMDMKGMDMDAMYMDTAMMPGMLTGKQMIALRKANGRQFDKLFLKGMIQHHGGALIMVRDLFNQPAAGQDATLFDFANDVDNTQTAEIDMMKKVLRQEKLL